MLRAPSPRHANARLALLLCLALTAGCASVTTRIAGWYVTREIDSYLDLNSEQKKEVRHEVDRTLDALRRDQLPHWLNLLRSTRDTIGRGADEPAVTTLQTRYDQLMDAGVDLLAPKFARVFATLDEPQIDHFERHAKERLDEVYEDRELAPEKRRKKQDEQLVEALESVVGGLREEQERTILAFAHTLPDEWPAQYRVSRDRIGRFAAFLRTHPGPSAIEAELFRLWRTRYDELGAGRDLAARRAEQRQFILTVDRTLSPAQRREGVDNLNERIQQLARFALPEAD